MDAECGGGGSVLVTAMTTANAASERLAALAAPMPIYTR